jgi:hypothetical protein
MWLTRTVFFFNRIMVAIYTLKIIRVLLLWIMRWTYPLTQLICLKFSRFVTLYHGLLVGMENVLGINILTVRHLFFLNVNLLGFITIFIPVYLLQRLNWFELEIEHLPIFFRQFQKLQLWGNLYFWKIEVPWLRRLSPLNSHLCLLFYSTLVYYGHRNWSIEELMIKNRLHSYIFILCTLETQVHELWEKWRVVKQLCDARHLIFLKTILHPVEKCVSSCSHLPDCKFKHGAPELVKVSLDSFFKRFLLLKNLLTTELGANLS